MPSSYITSTNGILKAVIIVCGILSVILGFLAHFTSSWYNNAKNSDCQKIKNCPSGAKAMEGIFIFVTVVTFLMSIVNLIAFCVMKAIPRTIKYGDLIFHVAAGVLISVGGILMVIAAMNIDSFVRLKNKGNQGRVRAETKFFLKLSAAGFGILTGILYFTLAYLMKRTHRHHRDRPPPSESSAQVEGQDPTDDEASESGRSHRSHRSHRSRRSRKDKKQNRDENPTEGVEADPPVDSARAGRKS